MSTVRFELSLTTEHHGCNRLAREGERIPEDACGEATCIDCAAHGLVVKFAASVDSATLTHWPDDPRRVVVDDLHHQVRAHGRFAAARDLRAVIDGLTVDGADPAKIARLRTIAASV